MYQAGLVIQIWYVLMLSRDLLITLTACKKGHSDAIIDIGLLHYLLSCFDIAVLGGLVIWGTVAVNHSLIQQCQALPEDTGCAAFLKATRANIYLGWVYIVVHCCACPIAICCFT